MTLYGHSPPRLGRIRHRPNLSDGIISQSSATTDGTAHNMKVSKSYKAEAIAELKKWLPQGATLEMHLARVSRSGMSRVIRCSVIWIDEEGKHATFQNLSGYVARAIGHTLVEGFDGGVRIFGCGMDMGLALADIVSYELYGLPLNQNHRDDNSEDEKYGIRYRWIN